MIDQKGMKEYQDKLAMELPKAEFEDLQRAAENWNDILEKLSVPARRYLKRNDAGSGHKDEASYCPMITEDFCS